jgi:ectoine hydroxylase-related dioxygenase (phytanoyl-CoA dioxygenase family)
VIPAERLTFARDGAQRFDAAISENLPDLVAMLADLPTERAGVRLRDMPAIRHLLTPTGAIGTVAASVLGNHAQAVRAVLFDKTAATNWSLGWHQDRTIVVRERRAAPGFGPWTLKDGLHHVAPPFQLLADMVTLRVHLDPVTVDNAPLLIAPGSHRFGRVTVDRIDAVVGQCGTACCTARAGDIWLYATPILHASDTARQPARRRVLQIDFSDRNPGDGLEWLGV